MEIEKNLRTIRYSLTDVGFSYHFLKGIMRKGSIISKINHPFIEVEELKKNLIIEKKVKTLKGNLVLKDNLKTGVLMAYNLYSGEIKKELPSDNWIVINRNGDENLKKIFLIDKIYSTDFTAKNKLDYGSLRLIGIYNYRINYDFFRGASANEFSPSEELVLEVLKKVDIVDSCRHGNHNANECDIVCEKKMTQIEIIIEYKTRISDKLRTKHDEMFLMELVAHNVIAVSTALDKKIYKKDYTDKYEKKLAVLCFGNSDSVVKMLDSLINLLDDKGTPKNNYTNMYLIIYDVYNDCITILYNGIEKTFSKDDFHLDIFNKEKIKLSEIVDDKAYYVETMNIFNDEIGLMIADKSTIMEYFKDVGIL